jgi:hypothetical protein
VVLHQEPPLFHRDIRWPNIVRRADDPSLWFLIDWEDASGSNTLAANHLSPENHSPCVFTDNHGGEVDIWGVGMLITESAKGAFNIPSKLVTLGKWMQDDQPTAVDALNAVTEYVTRYLR